MISAWFLNESQARPAHCRSLKRRRRLSLIDYRGSRIGCMRSGWNVYYYLTLISYLTREIMRDYSTSAPITPIFHYHIQHACYLSSIYFPFAISPFFRTFLSHVVEGWRYVYRSIIYKFYLDFIFYAERSSAYIIFNKIISIDRSFSLAIFIFIWWRWLYLHIMKMNTLGWYIYIYRYAM